MIPAKIEDVFLQLTTDNTGVITNIIAGKFSQKEFLIQESIYNSCPFLEGTLEALPLNESFLLEKKNMKSNLANISIEDIGNENEIKIVLIN